MSIDRSRLGEALMGIRKSPHSLRRRIAGLATALGLAAASILIAPAGAAAAEPPAAPTGSPPRGVTSRTVTAKPSLPPVGSQAKLGLRPKDSARSGIMNGDDGTFTCSLFTQASQWTSGYDGYLEEVASVLFFGSIDCDAQL